jgi:prophage maintenance system killer protein
MPPGGRSCPAKNGTRPPANAFGPDAYQCLDEQAAALLHSLARNHALIDGNKRLSLGALIAFYGLHGRRLSLTNDAAYDLVMAVGRRHLRRGSRRRRLPRSRHHRVELTCRRS